MTNELPEAPASATLSVITPKGYNTLFTVRDVEVKNLVEKIGKLEEYFEKAGYKPQPARGGGFPPKKEAVVVGKCPTCNADLIEGITKTGKKYHKCSTNKWNAATKQAEGCAYISWLDK